MSNEIINFAQRKLSIARCLHGGQCGASYPEAVLVISSILSGLASLLWPGNGIDRKRFVELLIRYSAPNLRPAFISIPLLVKYLQNNKQSPAYTILQSTFLPNSDSRIVTSDEVDHTEQDIVHICPNLSMKELRQFSYANLLYTEVRSGFVHEYELNKSASPFPMTQRDVYVSYVNDLQQGRQIYFHYSYLVAVASSVAESTQPLLDKFPIQNPSTWWIDGTGTM